MKKIISFILLLSILFSLVACGTGNEENKDSKTDSVLSWVFLGAAGVLVLATALGILLHSRKKH